MKKRLFAAFVCLCMMLSMLPMIAFAKDVATPSDTQQMIDALPTGNEITEDSEGKAGPAIVMGADHIPGYNNGYHFVYYGEWNSSPIKWRVLDDQTNIGEPGLFLLSEYLLSDVKFDVGSADDESDRTKTWQGSDAQAWCKNFYVSNFSVGEQHAVLATTKSDDWYKSTSCSTDYAETENILDGDRVFFLSGEEAENSKYGFTDNEARIAQWEGSDLDVYWLRSPFLFSNTGAGAVYHNGQVCQSDVNSNWTARPAFNLDQDAVLFTSAAEGGKNDAAVDSDLTAVGMGTGEWKLTLKDDSRRFAVTSDTTVTIERGKTEAISYSGAQTGDNEYVSAMIVDESGTILYYGRVAQNSESGTASVAIPADLQPGSYTLKMFSEQYNGDKKTDYASAFVDISLTVTDTTAPTLTEVSVTRDSESKATVKFISNEAGSYYYAVVESGADTPTIDTDGAGTACDATEQTITLDSLSGAGAKDVYILAKDNVGNVSQPLKITIPEYIAPVYEISANPQSLEFETVTEGYTKAPAAKEVTITNTGNRPLNLNQPASSDAFVVSPLSKTALAAGDTATFTVQPKAGLAAGTYSEPVVVSGSNVATVSIPVTFTVKQHSSAPTYDINVADRDGGALELSHAFAVAGATVTVTAQPEAGYHLDSLTVTDADGGLVELKKLSDNRYSFKMPKSDVTVQAQFVRDGENYLPFTDVQPDDWFYGPVGYVYEHGLMTGTSDSEFSPNLATTRGMLVTMLYRLEGEPDTSADLPFTDVDVDAYYADAIRWAAGESIVSGMSDELFAPNAALTREQLAAMLQNYAAWKGADVSARADLSAYSDASSISGWARDALEWAVAEGIVSGMTADTLAPQGEATRAQVAAMLQRFLGE